MSKENPFKKIGYPPKEVPEVLKDRVIKEVSTAKLLMDKASLVTKNYKETLASMFLTKNKETSSDS